jgi:molybdopterin-binding protein
VIPRQTAEDMALERGGKAAACFDATHVILAVN